jgi:hypothetical protein
MWNYAINFFLDPISPRKLLEFVIIYRPKND